MRMAIPITDRVNDVKPWYTHRWPWFLMLGPALVVVAASYSGYIAFTRQDAMVVDDYYKQGNAINQDLRRDKVATNMGLAFAARYDAAAGKLTGDLLSFGQPLPGKMLIRLSHATLPEKDRLLEVQPDQSGRFDVALPGLDRARWEVSIENQARSWRLAGTWKWPQEPTINLKADLPPAD